MRLKVNAVDIFASKTHGLVHSGHFMVIMKDMKPHILNLLLVIILLGMDVAGIPPPPYWVPILYRHKLLGDNLLCSKIL